MKTEYEVKILEIDVLKIKQKQETNDSKLQDTIIENI